MQIIALTFNDSYLSTYNSENKINRTIDRYFCRYNIFYKLINPFQDFYIWQIKVLLKINIYCYPNGSFNVIISDLNNAIIFMIDLQKCFFSLLKN